MSATINTTMSSLLVPGEHSVLGEQQVRIPVGGKIRGGIMVLTAAGRQIKGAQEIYDAGVAAGKPFAVIGQELKTALKLERNILTPKNVPYFVVRRGDFVMPEVADAIMALYGSDGVAGYQLYRLPIILPIDSWLSVMPHGLKCYSRSELQFWSEYGPDGKRYCKTHGAINVDPKSKRAVRPFGGRPIILRAENDGLCNPEGCKEYQDRKCTLTGSFLFYIPGVPGSSAIQLSTNSFYSMQQARQKLEMVAFLHGGKISGTVGGKPIFYLTKKQSEVSMIDPETGKPKKVKQWLIEIEADIDMTRMFQENETPALLAAGEASAAALEDHSEFEPVEAEHDADDVAGKKPETRSAETADEVAEIKALRRKVVDALGVLGIDVNVFAVYAAEHYSQAWGITKADLELIYAELQLAADDDEEMERLKAKLS